jgi:hypothetical protein
MTNEPVIDVDNLWLRLQELYEDFREAEAKLELREALATAWELGKRTEAQVWAETADLSLPDEDREQGRNPFKETK